MILAYFISPNGFEIAAVRSEGIFEAALGFNKYRSSGQW